MVILNASGAQMIRAEPGDSPSHTRVSFVGLCHPDANEAEARQGYEFGKKVFLEEDLQAAVDCQKRVRSHSTRLNYWHE